jgi:hypothetical protein
MTDERRRPTVGSGERACPWCGGQLELRDAYPLTHLIPGEVGARAHDHIPESLRTTRAWVCATPHCRYREAA